MEHQSELPKDSIAGTPRLVSLLRSWITPRQRKLFAIAGLSAMVALVQLVVPSDDLIAASENSGRSGENIALKNPVFGGQSPFNGTRSDNSTAYSSGQIQIRPLSRGSQGPSEPQTARSLTSAEPAAPTQWFVVANPNRFVSQTAPAPNPQSAPPSASANHWTGYPMLQIPDNQSAPPAGEPTSPQFPPYAAPVRTGNEAQSALNIMPNVTNRIAESDGGSRAQQSPELTNGDIPVPQPEAGERSDQTVPQGPMPNWSVLPTNPTGSKAKSETSPSRVAPEAPADGVPAPVANESWSVLPDRAVLAKLREEQQQALDALRKEFEAKINDSASEAAARHITAETPLALPETPATTSVPRAASPLPPLMPPVPQHAPPMPQTRVINPQPATTDGTSPRYGGHFPSDGRAVPQYAQGDTGRNGYERPLGTENATRADDFRPFAVQGGATPGPPPAVPSVPNHQIETLPPPTGVPSGQPYHGFPISPGNEIPVAPIAPDRIFDVPYQPAQPNFAAPSGPSGQAQAVPFLQPSPPPANYSGGSQTIGTQQAMSGHSVFGVRPGTSGFRATVECDAPVWMSPYNNRANCADSESINSATGNLAPLPPGFAPWWDTSVRQATGAPSASLPVNVSTLLQDAMLYSPQVTAIKTEPEVQYRVVTQEAAKFDWMAFLETSYDDLNDPVGNELTTGNNQDRLLTRKLRGAAGFRSKNIYGGEVRIAQELGHENQNSRFFIPNNQGTSRLELSYRQPLLDGAGRAYNESEIILASIQANSSEDEVVGALQEHLIEVTEAYWAVYRARAEYFQRQKLLVSAKNVLTKLEGRSQVDTIPRQVLRSRAAVARAQTRIQRTMARVEDAEAQLRLLVNSPGMTSGGPVEVIPLEAPNMVTEQAELQSVLQAALINRPDISEAIRKMRASTVRLGVSRQELLPRLDFIVESYVADLSGNSDIARSVRGQFTDNRPGYTLGLEFELPIENRAAKAKLEQRQWELKRSINVFRATVEKSLTDTEIARREVATAYSEIISHYHSMMAAQQESNYLMDRFTVLPAAEDSATLLLEDLLDSFERLADEEASFVQVQVEHSVALIKLKKEMGILLQSRNARPSVESADEVWMNSRLQASAPGAQMSPGDNSLAGQRDNPAGNPQQSSPSIGQTINHTPVTAHPTSWARPAKQTPVTRSAGYSIQ